MGPRKAIIEIPKGGALHVQFVTKGEKGEQRISKKEYTIRATKSGGFEMN